MMMTLVQVGDSISPMQSPSELPSLVTFCIHLEDYIGASWWAGGSVLIDFGISVVSALVTEREDASMFHEQTMRRTRDLASVIAE